MNNPFNKLTDAEAERIAVLMEECAEVIKCCGKILRHGYESVDPTGKEPGTNREQLATEMGQLDSQSQFMQVNKDYPYKPYVSALIARSRKITDKIYLHHQ